MKRKTDNSGLIFLAIVLVGGGWFMGQQNTPVVPPDAPSGPDLIRPFRSGLDSTRAKQDSLDFGTLCEEIASLIEFDGQQTTPRLKTGVQFDDFRLIARSYRLRGRSLATEYPELPTVVGSYLDSKLGNDGGPVSEASRKAWVDAYRALGRSAQYASSHL